MRVRIVDAGHGERAAKIDELRLRSLGLEQRLICARSSDDSIAHGNGADKVELALAQPHTGQNVAVIVDGVWRSGLCGER